MKPYLGFLLVLIVMMNLSSSSGGDRDRGDRDRHDHDHDRDLDHDHHFDFPHEDDEDHRPRPHIFGPFPCVAGGSVCSRDMQCCSGECERGGRRRWATCCGKPRSLCFEQSDCCDGLFCLKFNIPFNPFGQGFCSRIL